MSWEGRVPWLVSEDLEESLPAESLNCLPDVSCFCCYYCCSLALTEDSWRLWWKIVIESLFWTKQLWQWSSRRMLKVTSFYFKLTTAFPHCEFLGFPQCFTNDATCYQIITYSLLLLIFWWSLLLWNLQVSLALRYLPMEASHSHSTPWQILS